MGMCLLGPKDVEDKIAGLEVRVACGRSLAGREDEGCRVELTVCIVGDCILSICGTPSSRRHPVKVQVHDASKERICKCLVANADQIITQLLHSIRCLPRLYMLWVVSNEDRLLSLDYHHTLFSLQYQSGQYFVSPTLIISIEMKF